MAAPKQRRAVPIAEEKSSAGMWMLLLLLAGGGAAIWKFKGADLLKAKDDKPARAQRVVAQAATPAPAPMATVPTPPVPSQPAEDSKPAPAPVEPAPTPTVASQPTENPFAELLVLDAVAGRKAENVQKRETFLQKAIAGQKWNEYVDLLRRSMAAELKKNFSFDQPQAYDRYLTNPIFYTALVQSAFIDSLPAEGRFVIHDDQAHGDFFHWLLNSTDGMEAWLMTVRPEDQVDNGLKNWAFIDGESNTARDKYRALALACSLVFDKEYKPEWNGETLSLSAGLRFNTYKQWDEKGVLETHLSKMSPDDLKWVINAPVPDSELEWARKKMRLKQSDWGKAYGMVPYDMDKAVTGKQKKPYDSYTFEEILKKGGVCGDRAYFAVNTARALGIPAAVIGGDGPMGGHAWFRWKADDHTWKEDGRISGYGAGNTSDPQTGKGISELEFVRLSDRDANSEGLNERAYRFLWLAQLHEALGEKSRADAAVEFALAVNRNNHELWEAKLAYWSRNRAKAPVEDWDKFLDSWKHEFAKDADLLAVARKAEEQFIYPRQDSKTVLHDMRSDARALERQRNAPPATAADVAELYQRQGAVLAKDKDYAAIRAIYHRGFREHAMDAAAFKRMARDYFDFVREDEKAKADAAHEIESAFDHFVETKDLNWFTTQSQNSCMQVVADCWKEAGKPERAERMAKEMERRTKRAKREAL